MEIGSQQVNVLARKYNPLDYSYNLRSLLATVYPYEHVDTLSKLDLHRLLNNTLLRYYRGEQIYKYQLFQRYCNRNVTAAFEIKINNSRLDFLTIGDFTTSYEIKTELDNLSKLEKQISDYLSVFDFNYLIIDQCHLEKALDLVPNIYGLWVVSNGKYRRIRKAIRNESIDPKSQLGLLTKKELSRFFNKQTQSVADILPKYKKCEINKHFKTALASRYYSRWEFVKNHVDNILPVDIQFFFSTNVNPSVIYS